MSHAARVAGYRANSNAELTELGGLYYPIGHEIGEVASTDTLVGRQWQYRTDGPGEGLGSTSLAPPIF